MMKKEDHETTLPDAARPLPRAQRGTDPAGFAGRSPTRSSVPLEKPRIAAFIWGGKIRPTPTLRYGRWKGAG